ncbi:MAG: hypothetical protein KKH28_00665 [Elusimicrobia bacterium]|nr:hypothetical protein [Elusimicrobiota bacterium]
MSALSQIAAMEGRAVTGSDRDFDNSRNLGWKASLEKLGIKIFPQNGSGVDGDTAELALSTAIEDSNPEITRAKAFGAKIIHRSELLAHYVDSFRTVAVGGTSGKSTVVGMVFTILEEAGLGPSVITGGPLAALQEKGLIGNAWRGKSDILVIEADESDGTIEKYRPAAGLILNISKDHKEVPALKEIFRKFAANSKKVYVNGADPELADFRNGAEIFGMKDAGAGLQGLSLGMFGSHLKMGGVDFEIPAPGLYNVQNALASVKVCLNFGVTLEVCAAGLAKYKGIQRRFQTVGETGGILVVDDYAHNPAKVAAVLGALRRDGGRRIIAVYQPHGYAPTRLLKKELIEAFAASLGDGDVLFMPEIFYAGGTVAKDISSKYLVDELSRLGKKAFYFERRADIVDKAVRLARPGDIFIVMGARDWTLSDFAKELFEKIKEASVK